MGLFLGIDSSNYTSSAALLDEAGRILRDDRIMLDVKEGQQGLRQSDALFQHWKNLPQLLEPVLREFRDDIEAVCVSTKPRPADGSYMPVFTAGERLAEIISAALGVPLYRYSHQEGHIAAASMGNDLDFGKPVVSAHLSGGTLELVKVSGGQVELLGATRDISYGQLLDRVGVSLGYPFPAGKYIDERAMRFKQSVFQPDGDKCSADAPESLRNPFCRVFTASMDTNLSGLETQLKTAVRGLRSDSAKTEDPKVCLETDRLCYFLMERISESFVTIMERARKEAGAEQVLVGGGVASSRFLREYCGAYGYRFGEPRLCSDNACGLAYMKDRGLCL